MEEDDNYSRLKIDSRRLIRVVKKYPALYDTRDPSYARSKTETRTALWKQVCREVIPGWNSLLKEEKIVTAFDVQKRWKNLRTCFGRELIRQQEDQQRRQKNLAVKMRKVYHYFNMLRFLRGEEDTSAQPSPATEVISEDSDDPLTNMKTESYDAGEVEFEIEAMDDDTFAQEFETSNEDYEPTQSDRKVETKDSKVYKKHKDVYERQSNTNDGKVLEYLKDVKKDEDDDDKHFLMSLIPTFRKLDDKQKFEARIEILKVLKDISFRSDPGSSL